MRNLQSDSAHRDPFPGMNQNRRPANDEPSAPRPPAVSRPETLAARSLKILLAEDQDLNRIVEQTLLRRLGHEVRVVDNGKRALEATRAEWFDLILLDVQMPVMDGFSAVAKIRADDGLSGRHLPIIALTARDSDEDGARCLAAGFDACIGKPLSTESFHSAIARISPRSPWPPSEFASTPGITPPYDRGMALENLGGDESLFGEILRLFLDNCPVLVSRIGDAIADDHARTLRNLAHTLRGSASHFAAGEVVESAKKLETIAAKGSCQGASEEFQVLLEAVARLRDALIRERVEP